MSPTYQQCDVQMDGQTSEKTALHVSLFINVTQEVLGQAFNFFSLHR